MALILAYKNRGIARDITIRDADGEIITPGKHDKVRVTIGRAGASPALQIVSGSPTENGSKVVKGNVSRLRLDGQDMTFTPGTYQLMIDYFDNADDQEWKHVERHTLHMLESNMES